MIECASVKGTQRYEWCINKANQLKPQMLKQCFRVKHTICQYMSESRRIHRWISALNPLERIKRTKTNKIVQLARHIQQNERHFIALQQTKINEFMITILLKGTSITTNGLSVLRKKQ